MSNIVGAAEKQTVTGELVNFNSETATYRTFQDQRFEGVDFRRSDLRLARFVRCEFVDCPFDSADMQHCRFESCRLEYSNGYKQSKGRMSNTTWKDCQIVVGQSWALPHVSLRGAKFENCKFGKIEFEATTIEYADFVDCEFEAIAMINGIVSGAQFRNCLYSTCKFSLPSFLSVYGSHSFLSAQTVELISSAKDRALQASGTVNVKENISVFLRERSDGLPPSYVVNGIIEIAKLEGMVEQVRPKIVGIVASYLSSDTIDPVQRLDETEATLGLLHYHELHDELIYQKSKSLLDAARTIRLIAPASLIEQFTKTLSEYRSGFEKKMLVKFHFTELEYGSPSDVARAISWLYGVAELNDHLEISNMSVSSGSLDIQTILEVFQANWWNAVLLWLAVKVDPHKLLDQAVTFMPKKNHKAKTDELRSEAEKMGISVVIVHSDGIALDSSEVRVTRSIDAKS